MKKTKVFEKNPLEGVKFSVQVCYNGFANPDLLPDQRLVGVLPTGPARIKSIFGSGAMPAPVQVKAAGGIRNSDDFLAMVRAGATRIGCSAGVKIIEALKQRMKDDGVTSIDIKTEY